MNDDVYDLLWIGAFRYYCGRKTYAVSSFVSALILNWAAISERARIVIRRDLDGAFADHFRALAEGRECSPLGMDCDAKEWDKVRTMWREAE